NGKDFKGIDLLAGGLPCPPFSVAGKKLGKNDERNLFPEAIRLVEESRPKAVMIENVRGIFESIFDDYRAQSINQLENLGYKVEWKILNASDFGVPQLRPRAVLVALLEEFVEYFSWPVPNMQLPPTTGEVLYDLMASRGWKGAERWRKQANKIAPTIVGGSL